MANLNQAPGPSPATRLNRYGVRMKMAQKVAAKLGGHVERGAANILTVVLSDGTRLGRKQAARLLKSRDS